MAWPKGFELARLKAANLEISLVLTTATATVVWWAAKLGWHSVKKLAAKWEARMVDNTVAMKVVRWDVELAAKLVLAVAVLKENCEVAGLVILKVPETAVSTVDRMVAQRVAVKVDH